MNSCLKLIAAVALAVAAAPTLAALNVFATMPEWGCAHRRSWAATK